MRACSKKANIGRIHSLESFGTHEGPGIRFLVFLQGCIARCLYCQNPDTWQLNSGFEMSAGDLFEKVKRCLPYINSSKGGVTVSGGEPLLQIDFLKSLFTLCRRNNVHTAVDTSAFFKNKDKSRLDKLIDLTDLFIVDIKAADAKLHKKITSRDLDEVLDFVNILETQNRPYWVRYVLVPGLNDSKKDITALKGILSGLTRCQRFEFLPYHTLGKHKWGCMKLNYALEKVLPAGSKDLNAAEKSLGYTRLK